MWHFLAHGWLLFQSVPHLFTSTEGGEQIKSAERPGLGYLCCGFTAHLPLCRHHSGTQRDLSDTTAAQILLQWPRFILINLAHIQIRQDGMSLLQILQASTDQLIVWLPPFLWSLFLFLASSFLLQAPISMHKHRSSVLSGSLSPSQVIFSLLNETFMTQVCGPKYNECCCHWKGCIIHMPGEVKHIGWKQAPLSNQFGLNSVTALKILRRKGST